MGRGSRKRFLKRSILFQHLRFVGCLALPLDLAARRVLVKAGVGLRWYYEVELAVLSFGTVVAVSAAVIVLLFAAVTLGRRARGWRS